MAGSLRGRWGRPAKSFRPISSRGRPTAELRENQTDQDSLPPYDMLDAILERLVEKEEPLATIVDAGFDRAVVARIDHLLNIAEYKRRQAAPGVKVTSRNFGRDRRYPITNRFRDSGQPLAGAGPDAGGARRAGPRRRRSRDRGGVSGRSIAIATAAFRLLTSRARSHSRRRRAE